LLEGDEQPISALLLVSKMLLTCREFFPVSAWVKVVARGQKFTCLLEGTWVTRFNLKLFIEPFSSSPSYLESELPRL
jgi:hypothetical protein